MKKILFVFMLLPFCSLAQGFEIKGKAGEWNAPAKAYLFYSAKVDGIPIVDSATLVNGVFKFKGTVNEPVIATFILDEGGIGLPELNIFNADLTIFYLNNEVITFSSVDSAKKAIVSSAINDSGAAYFAFVRANMPAGVQDSVAAMRTGIAAYIGQHPSSYFSLLALSNLVVLKEDAGKLGALYKSISPVLQRTAQGKRTAREIELLRVTSIGATAPLFTQPDSSGAPVSLSAFRGKYVLVDFWASWCMPCREENPHLVKAYKKYHPKGLEILGVSLDGEGQRGAWLEAIRKDSLSWTQVSDLKAGENAVARLYGIQNIPQNFLLDPDGKIIASGLRGEELEKKLEEIYTK